ncbi:hypothetical protein NBRC110019_23560 [Neptunitalea chrysea]|uniref:Uncharacterized protein n=1 Tax=Neptunitalea chrysea TaxID=1647581 RepID=A0A9W6EUC4_9FLAO|nr:hypothetical protein [Neptunitalea chrysea]GLB53315.1 hypothetical protein NBRC110019_23560 [Neptunitalea chrysea]
MKKLLITLVLLFSVLGSWAQQQSVNEYAYVVVPMQYGFLKKADEYNINSLTKFLFEKYGFTTYLEDDIPSAKRMQPCEGLRANVTKESGFLRTKLKVTLKNCSGVVVFESRIGESREKEFDKAFNLALRDAFKDVEALHYSYEVNAEPVKLVEEVKTFKEKGDEKKEEIVTKVEDVNKVKNVEQVQEAKSGLIAKPYKGLNYKVYDTAGKEVMILLYTTIKDVYMVKGKDEIVHKINNTWIIEGNDGNESMGVNGLDITFESSF